MRHVRRHAEGRARLNRLADGDDAAGSVPGEQALVDLNAIWLDLVFGEANYRQCGRRCRPHRDEAGIKGRKSLFLVVLQFIGNEFCCHMCLV